jgi:hypothetical protein
VNWREFSRLWFYNRGDEAVFLLTTIVALALGIAEGLLPVSRFP